MTKQFDEIGQITDEELIARLRALVRADQALSARLLVHLGEVDARGLYRARVFFDVAYCVEELRMRNLRPICAFRRRGWVENSRGSWSSSGEEP